MRRHRWRHLLRLPGSAATAGQLRALGFDLVNQANNHSLDYGHSGRAQTIAALTRAGVASTGLPGQITYRRFGGIRIAFVGFAPYAVDGNLLDIPAAQALVRRARKQASVVVVIIHAGAEGAGALHTPYGSEHYLGEDRGNPRAFAHAVVNAGASLVLGSGPHVIRGVERYRGRLIAYSLGDFVGYHTLPDAGVLAPSAILRVTLGARGSVLGGRWISDPSRPRTAAPGPEQRQRQIDDVVVSPGLPGRPLHDRAPRLHPPLARRSSTPSSRSPRRVPPPADARAAVR